LGFNDKWSSTDSKVLIPSEENPKYEGGIEKLREDVFGLLNKANDQQIISTLTFDKKIILAITINKNGNIIKVEKYPYTNQNRYGDFINRIKNSKINFIPAKFYSGEPINAYFRVELNYPDY